ncbi:hypothetical protein, partial [Fulvivirga kasyanovii]|uniref:hypothetical protein n=1 Tax=Fulvivirga kasyanovii TaxID=396812 RepID=UPI001C887B53
RPTATSLKGGIGRYKEYGMSAYLELLSNSDFFSAEYPDEELVHLSEQGIASSYRRRDDD